MLRDSGAGLGNCLLDREADGCFSGLLGGVLKGDISGDVRRDEGARVFDPASCPGAIAGFFAGIFGLSDLFTGGGTDELLMDARPFASLSVRPLPSFPTPKDS